MASNCDGYLKMSRVEDTAKFYALLQELERSKDRKRTLADCDGKIDWPRQGVYFFFEPGEYRSGGGSCPRVVRVGTHAIKGKADTTLWSRLRQHRGTLNPLGGNHRGSVFRKLIGEAMIRRDCLTNGTDTWGRGNTARRDVREAERPIEIKVSRYIGAMPFLIVPVLDAPGPGSKRGYIERNAIALLCAYNTADTDTPFPQWLGCHSSRERVQRSGLWNNDHVNEDYSPEFLNVLEESIDAMNRTQPLTPHNPPPYNCQPHPNTQSL